MAPTLLSSLACPTTSPCSASLVSPPLPLSGPFAPPGAASSLTPPSIPSVPPLASLPRFGFTPSFAPPPAPSPGTPSTRSPTAGFPCPLSPLPFPLHFQLTSPGFIGVIHSVQCTSFATKLIMVAGSRLSKDEFPLSRPQLEPALECPLIFDTETREWTEGAPFPVPRKWCACGTAFGKLYITSGCGKNWDVGLSKSVDMYNPEKETWVSLDDLKSSKFSGEAISAVNYGGNLHMVSGKGVFCKVGVVYNPTTGKWTDMPRGMRDGWIGPCIVVDERLIVLEATIGKLKEYDPVKDSWFTIMEDEMLKNMEELTGAQGKICGIVRAAQGSCQQDLIRIVDIRALPTVTDLLPPFGQIVALQLLSGMTSCDEAS